MLKMCTTHKDGPRIPLGRLYDGPEEGAMPRVIHFEIHADAPKRASGFYSTVFGRKIKHWDGPQDYWLIETGPQDEPGIKGGRVR